MARRQLDAWLEGRPLDDASLAAYLGHLHEAGRGPATAAMVVATVKRSARDVGTAVPIGPLTRHALLRRGPPGRPGSVVLSGNTSAPTSRLQRLRSATTTENAEDVRPRRATGGYSSAVMIGSTLSARRWFRSRTMRPKSFNVITSGHWSAVKAEVHQRRGWRQAQQFGPDDDEWFGPCPLTGEGGGLSP